MRYEENIYEALKYWDYPWKPEQPLYTDKPDGTRTNSDDNFEAFWWYKVTDEDGSEHVGSITVVEFRPESFYFSYTQDILVYWEGSDIPEDDEGNPWYTEYGQEYCSEEVEFEKRAFLQFLSDLLSGRIKRDSRQRSVRTWTGEPYTYAEHFWASGQGSPAGRQRLPRSRAELARWVAEAGYEYVRNSGTGCDYVEGLPEAAWDVL